MQIIDIYGNFVDKQNPFIPVIIAMSKDPRIKINIMGPVNHELLHIQKKKYEKGNIAFGYGSPREIAGMHMGEYDVKLGYISWETNKVPYGSFYGFKKSLQQLDLLIVPNKWQELLFEHVGVPISIIPLPKTDLDIRSVKSVESSDVFTFLCIGRLTLKDNIGYIISSVMSLAKTYSRIKLILKTESGTLGHLKFPEKNIEIIDGAISDEEYLKLYLKADCFVYPTSTDPTPIHYYNAISLGLPIIAPSHSGFAKDNVLKKHELIPAERYSRKYGNVGSYWSIDYDELYGEMEKVILGNFHYGSKDEYHTVNGFVNDILKLVRNI